MVGIIIINYKTYKKTIECITSILKETKSEYKIYVIDNNSENDSIQVLEEKYGENKNIKIIKSEKNLGYANGNNVGIKHAFKDGCKYVIISNNDIIIIDNAIDKLIKCMQENKDYSFISPKILSTDLKKQNSTKLVRPTFREYLFNETYLNNFISNKSFKCEIEKENDVYKKIQNVYWISGCFFCARLTDFQIVDLFDKNTFLYYEEYILSEKAAKYNLKLGYCSECEVIHHHGATTGKLNINVHIEHFKSELYFGKTYCAWGNVQLFIIWLIRNLEIVWTFGKLKNYKDVWFYFRKSFKILRQNFSKLFH